MQNKKPFEIILHVGRVTNLQKINNGIMMSKSKSAADILRQTDGSYRQYGTCCTSIIEQK